MPHTLFCVDNEPEFELVPLDVFMNMAGENPTFAENYRPDSE